MKSEILCKIKGYLILVMMCLFVAACGGPPVAATGLSPTNVTGNTGTLSALAYIPYNSSTTITWSSSIDASCTLTGDGATTGVNGTSGKTGVFVTPLLKTDTVYSLKCGDVSQSISIHVASSAIASSITAFAAGSGGVTTVITLNSLSNGTQISINGTTSYNGTYTVTNQTSTSFDIAKTFVSGTENETGFWQLAGGMIYGCSTTATQGSLAAIDLSSYTASQYRGVAPLSVLFDASGTVTDGSITNRPFHDIEYKWDFADAAGSPVTGKTWTTGSQAATATCSSSPYNGCRNNASGAVAAHVFETPGVYNIKLTATDGTNKVTNSCAQIVVQDPSALTTACVANGVLPSAGVGGCPPYATKFYNSGNFNATLSTAIATDGVRQLLFRRGDTFTVSSTYTITTAGDGIIGAYGTGSAPFIAVNSLGNYSKAIDIAADKWRIMDLNLDGTGTAKQFAFGVVNSNILLLRVETNRFNYAVNGAAENLTIADSYLHTGSNAGAADYGVWCAPCNHLAMLGNNLYLNSGNSSHNVRVEPATNFVISNSTHTGSYGIEPMTIRGDSQYGVVSDNKLIDNIVTVKPQNSVTYEYQRDIIFERNWFVAGSYTGPSLGVEGSGITIRNNIFDLSAVAGAAVNISYNSTVGSPKPDLVNIYNNTIYSNLANNGNFVPFNVVAYFGALDGCCHSELKNNLAYSPNSFNAPPALIGAISGSPVITGAAGTFGNSSDSQIKTSPSFVSATPSNPADYTIGLGSYAHNAGVAVPVFSDFFGTDRSNSNDSGAILAH
jgi:hypothetical protein